MKVANALAYYDTATITSIKCFINRSPRGQNNNVQKMDILFSKLLFFVIVSQFHWF
jgi:hypothetical protein